jgi:hypothetical protein
MKWIVIIFVLAIAATFTFYQSKLSPQKKIFHNLKSFAVLELFTSEGCSSCPPADRLLPVLAKEDSNIITLSFHVDYWDNLGWKDSFSKASFTERQRQYAEQLHLESIYTPQLIINGQYEMVGSNRTAVENFIKKVQEEPALAEINITDVKKQEQDLSVACHLNGDIKNTQLIAALVQKQAERKIGAGENGGATLIHTNIVRSLVVTNTKTEMKFNLNIPEDVKDGEWQLILYTQRNSDLKITGAASYK